MAKSSKCAIDSAAIEQIQEDMLTLVSEVAFGSGSEFDLEARVMEKIKEYSQIYNLQKKNVLIKTIFDSVSDVAGASAFLSSVDKMGEYLEDITKGGRLSDSQPQNSNIIETVEDAKSRKDMTSAFLTKAYGTAINIRNWVDRRFTKNLVDSFLVDRERGIVISDTTELNEHINEFKETLFKQITDYLNSKRTSLNKIPDDISSRKMFEDQSYTGILEDPEFKALIKNYVLKGIEGESSDVLTDLFKSDINKLEAFNAYTILSNFDTYVNLKLGSSIIINNPGRHEWRKYQFANKNKNIVNNFQIGEDISLDKEVSDVVKLLINTTKLYDWQGTQAKDDKYLTFAKFSTFIGRLKNSVFAKLTKEVKFDADFNQEIWDELSEETKNILVDKTLAEVINESKRNTQSYLSAIFELLTNKKFYDNYRSLYGVQGLNVDNSDDLSTLYSIYKGIFSKNDSESLLSLRDNNLGKHNYYSDITAIINSIYRITHVQYFENERGQIKMRTLLDQGLNNISRKIEQSINISHNSRISSSELTKDNEVVSNQATNTVTVKFNIGEITVTADTTGNIKFEKNGNLITFDEDNLNEIVPFIDEHLPLDLSSDSVLLESILNDKDLSITAIAEMAVRSVLNQYVQDTKLSGFIGKQLQDNVQRIFGEHQKVNFQLNQVNMISQKDIPTLRRLSIQKALLSGQLDSSQVKDAEGNGISQEGLNRLFECYQSQIDLFKSQPNFALAPLSIVKKGLIAGVASARELKTNDSLKKAIAFNPAEGQFSQIVYDFIYGLIEKGTESTDVLKKGMVAFTPSVFSDKPLIGKLLVDLNQEINGIKLSEAKTEQLLDIFAPEIAQVYQNVINQITSDITLVLQMDPALAAIYKEQPFLYDLENGFMGFNGYVKSLNDSAIEDRRKKLEQAKTDPSILEANPDLLSPYVHLTPIKYLNDLVKKYNEVNPQHKISLVPEIHYCLTKSNELTINNSLLEQKTRFSNKNNTKEWLTNQSKRMLKSLLESEFVLDCSNNSLESQYLSNQTTLEQWINKSGNLILAKIKVNDKSYTITTQQDLLNIYKDNPEIKNIDDLLRVSQDFEFNPLLERINTLDYFITQEFMLATVGTFAAHKVKGGYSNILEEESLRYYAQHKRNNDLTASTHAFELGRLDGIPEFYNIAVIKDFNDLLYNIAGKTDKTKPFDGSTIVNPFIVYLENNSLGPQRVGVTKKQFVHYYHPSLATGGDIKTAGFGMTNDWIRNSQFLQIAMRKMTSGKWRASNGELVLDLNILKTYDGKDIIYGENGIFFEKLGHYYKVTNIEYLGNNTYSRTLQEVDEFGSEVGSEQQEQWIIDNNYALWQLFGADRSMELDNSGRLQWSETSIENVVKAIINCGIVKQGVETVKTSDDVDQPLKNSDIHYLCNEGSIKYGAANINEIDAMNDDASTLNYFTIAMYNAGIQLDKEHSADESELSLMTQVMSACASMGYTFERAQKVYEALSQIGQINTNDLQSGIDDQVQTRKTVNKILAKAIATSNSSEMSFLDIFGKNLAKKINSNQDITEEDDIIPISDNSVISKIISTISVNLTKNGIRLKVPGTLSVISPGYKVFRVYAGKKLEEFKDFNTEIEALQQQQKAVYSVNDPNTFFSNIELGRTYIVRYLDGTQRLVELKVPTDYYKLRENLSNILDITESLREGRELASYNVRFKAVGPDGQIRDYNIYDLDSVQELAKIPSNEYASRNKIGLRRALQKDLKALSQNYKGVDKSLSVKIGGVDVQVDLNSIRIQNYEVIMPKVFASAFGLNKYDSVDKIKSDKYFFTKKLIAKNKVNVAENNYDLVLKKHSGQNIFLISDVTKSTGLKELQANIISDESGTYLIDINGNKIIQLSSPNDKIYTDGQNIIIKSDNFKHYIDNENYFTIQISTAVQNDSNILSIIDDSNNKNASKWYSLASELSDNFKNQNYKNIYDFSDITDDFWKDDKAILTKKLSDPRFASIFDQGQEIHNSWLLSLKVIAARIPAQSQQSFMAMDVVGYENADINNAYVSSMQLWLQGSDLDIDAVSLQTFDIRSGGKIELWSPYSDIQYEMKDSLELPFPTGKETQLIEVSNYPYAQESNKLLRFIQENVIQLYKNHKGQIKIRVRNTADVNKVKELLETYKDGILIPKGVAYKSKFIDAINAVDPYIQLSENDFNEVINQLKEVIDKHNLYLVKSNSSKQEQILNNFLLYNEIQIIQDPVNLLEAQTPVDDATDPFKQVGNNSKKGKATLYQSPGNMANKSEGIYNTQTGKGCVGICAVGMKTMFAITQYMNNVLNNGDESQQNRLLFPIDYQKDQNGNIISSRHGHYINGQWYTKVANIKALNPQTVRLNDLADAVYDIKNKYHVDSTEQLSNDQIIEILENSTDESDAAIALSALMSLATDNAKELQLSKLNAGMKTISMYIYGLSIGMSFKSISDIMLNDFVDTCAKLMEGNRFLHNNGLFSMDKVFDYFENGPSGELYKFKLADNFLNLIEVEDKYKGAKRLVAFTTDGTLTLEQKIKKLEDYILNNLGEVTTEHRKLLDFVKKYCLQQNERINCKYYDDIKTLAQGAEEFRILGSMLKLNQGLPNRISDIITLVSTIENSINNRIKNNNNEIKRSRPSGQLSNEERNSELNNRFNLFKFAFDEEYRQKCVEQYDSVKHTINILDVISTVPHYLQYVKTLATLQRAAQFSSIRYRSLYAIISDRKLQENGLGGENVIKGVNNFLGEHLIKQFLLTNDIIMTVPSFEYEMDGQKYNTVENQKIKLGTREGNIIFKAWMDKVLFKDLQKNGGISKNANIKNNAFIKALQLTLFTNTGDGNPIFAWGTKETMLPTNDFEQSQFDAIKNAFNDLLQYSYGEHPLSKLLFLYNLITYSGKLGTQTFTKLFENKQELDIIKDYHNYITDLDKSLEMITLDEDFDFNELLQYIAPKGSIYYSYNQYIRAKNAKGEYVLYEHKRNDSYLDDSEPEFDYADLFGEEEYSSRSSNYVPVNINPKSKSVSYKFNEKHVKLLGFNEDTGEITQIKVGNKTIKIPTDKLKSIYKADLKQGKIIDYQLVDDIIENELNPCE